MRMVFKEKKNLIIALGLIVVVILIGGVFYFKPKTPKTTAPAETETTLGKPGTVTGKVCYESEYYPKGKIVAKSTQTRETIVQDYPGADINNPNYSLELPPGSYYLRYDVAGPDQKLLSHFYTNYSECALADACGERKAPAELLPVKVEAGKTKENIHLCDFIYPANKIDF